MTHTQSDTHARAQAAQNSAPEISVPTALTVPEAARYALALAASAPPTSPNPQVGCVILSASTSSSIWDDATTVLAFGHHRGAGSPHAEAAALEQARRRRISVQGATAVVTLEPCAKQGLTPPCTRALIDAGVARVIYLVADPTGFGGGADALRSAGIEVFGPTDTPEGLTNELDLARRLLTPWIGSVKAERPFVVAKFASTIDGRIAAADGSSQWITGPVARRHVHQVRASVDAIAVGTGTVLADDPSLTVRLEEAHDGFANSNYQPRRIVIGEREIPTGARLRQRGGELIHLQTRDLPAALRHMFDVGIRHVVVEGGARLLAEFLRHGAVDEIHHYMAPALLGSGEGAVADFGVSNIAHAARWHRAHLLELGTDLLQVLTPSSNHAASAVPGTWHAITKP